MAMELCPGHPVTTRLDSVVVNLVMVVVVAISVTLVSTVIHSVNTAVVIELVQPTRFATISLVRVFANPATVAHDVTNVHLVFGASRTVRHVTVPPTDPTSPVCRPDTGKCTCLQNFGGQKCSDCSVGYYSYPDCSPM